MKLLYKFLPVVVMVGLMLSSCRLGRNPDHPAKEPTLSDAPTQFAESSPTSETEALTFQPGRNDYTITVDDTPREFIIHVPTGYDPNRPTPVVFMYHGTNGTGAEMYEYTNWARKGDEVTAIVVFPTSLIYFLINENQNAGKWNDLTLQELVGPDTQLKDDVKFTRAILDLVKTTFNVDEKRIFATGFSNGGQFAATRLLFEMNDVFASFAVSGSGIQFAREGFVANMPPKVSTSVYSILGTMDGLISEGTGIPLPLPFEAQALMDHETFGGMMVNLATFLNLDPTKYDVSHPRPEYTVFVFDQSLTGSDNEYIFQMVKDMEHIYPNGRLYPTELDAVDVFWEFFERHPLK